MKRLSLLLPVALGLSFSSFLQPLAGAQTWVFQKDGPSGVEDLVVESAMAADGSVVLAGTEGTGNAADFEIVKVSPDGQEAWSRVIDGGGSSEDLLHAVALDMAGDVYVTGR